MRIQLLWWQLWQLIQMRARTRPEVEAEVQHMPAHTLILIDCIGHAHIDWVLLSAARITVRALDCFTSHIEEAIGVWNRPCAPKLSTKPNNLLNLYVFILNAF